MSKIHTIPLHIGDLITDTMHLSAAELGGYVRLLTVHYRIGQQGLPDDDIQLRRITGLDNRTWRNCKQNILAYFTLDENRRWVHGKVQKVLSEIQSVQDQNRAKALKRWNTADATALPEQSNGSATAMQSISHKPEDKSKRIEDDDRERESGPFQRVYDYGCSLFPQLVTQASSVIHQWIEGGADIDLDIIPEIKRLHEKGIQPRGWGLFTQDIANAKLRRETPLPKGEPKNARPTTKHSGFQQQDYFAGTEGFEVVGGPRVPA
jgi:uncharacterized protein YdaU (DUF1376 family)